VPGFPHGLLRSYEDYVLGKVLADPACDRAADALRRYEGRDQARGLAFVLSRFKERAGLGGVVLNPAALRALARQSPAQVLQEGWHSCLRDGPLPALVYCYESLVKAARQSAELLGAEDLFELEHGTALSDFGQRLALRQVLTAARALIEALPRHRPPAPAGRQEVPTRVLDEDTYPVGGYASLATRGSIESLLHSQLSYMEPGERPDLFDIKFLRDELLYYSRDENNFLRRRRTFVLALFPDLLLSRFKDAALPWQRIILLLAALAALIGKLSEWLSTDALHFELVFMEPGKSPELAPERELVDMLFREQIAAGTVAVRSVRSAGELAALCETIARRSTCCCLAAGTKLHPLNADGTPVLQLSLEHSRPELVAKDGKAELGETEDLFQGWVMWLEALLARWM
jgi:hypothetical protein